jgi:GNAT superfamily N-acetyltransferase
LHLTGGAERTMNHGAMLSRKTGDAALDAIQNLRSGRATNADPLALYHACKEIDGVRGDGTFPIVGHRVCRFYDCRTRQPFYEPLGSVGSILSACRIKARLLEQHVERRFGIGMAFEAFRTAYAAPNGRLPLPLTGDVSVGQHYVAVCGWDEGGEEICFVNSWGREWGDSGQGRVTREYLYKYLSEAWLIIDARCAPTRHTWTRVAAAKDSREWARAWTMESPRYRVRFRHKGRAHQLVIYEVLSLESECPVDIIEIRTGRGLPVAWAHLFHLRAPRNDVSVLKELYVWPDYRRRGYGKILENFACRLARKHRSTQMEIWLHAADAVLAHRGVARAFAASLNYTWLWRSVSRPPIAAHLSKWLDRPTPQADH